MTFGTLDEQRRLYIEAAGDVCPALVTGISSPGKGDDNLWIVHKKNWLEVADPQHRYAKLLRVYYKEWKMLGTGGSFWDWLDPVDAPRPDLHHCTRQKLQSEKVTYCSPTQRQAYVVDIVDGVCYQNMQRVNTGNKGWIFVLGSSQLYAGHKVTESSPRFHHTSFLAGQPTRAAGMFIAKNGILSKVFPHSGHYRPSDQNLHCLLDYFKDSGVRLAHVSVDMQRALKVERSLVKPPEVILRAGCSSPVPGANRNPSVSQQVANLSLTGSPRPGNTPSPAERAASGPEDPPWLVLNAPAPFEAAAAGGVGEAPRPRISVLRSVSAEEKLSIFTQAHSTTGPPTVTKLKKVDCAVFWSGNAALEFMAHKQQTQHTGFLEELCRVALRRAVARAARANQPRPGTRSLPSSPRPGNNSGGRRQVSPISLTRTLRDATTPPSGGMSRSFSDRMLSARERSFSGEPRERSFSAERRGSTPGRLISDLALDGELSPVSQGVPHSSTAGALMF
jgi:hypothetical protein